MCKHNSKDNLDKVQKNEQNVVVVKVPIDGMRVSIEFIVMVCHIVNTLAIMFEKEGQNDLRWTVLTLCITTFSTVIQFQNEARWRFSGNFLFNIPFWGLIAIGVLIFASYIVEPLAVVTTSIIFSRIVAVLVTFRQVMHAIMIFKLYKEKKGEEDHD